MKFSIRDLFLVTVIVALAVAWWLDRSRLASEKRDLRKQRPWFGDANIWIDGTPMPNSPAPAPKPPKP